jgi:hypothetical protein
LKTFSIMALKLKFGSSLMHNLVPAVRCHAAAALTQVPLHDGVVGRINLTGQRLLLLPSTSGLASGHLLRRPPALPSLATCCSPQVRHRFEKKNDPFEYHIAA